MNNNFFKNKSLSKNLIRTVFIISVILVFIANLIMYETMKKTLETGYKTDLNLAIEAMEKNIDPSNYEAQNNEAALDNLKSITGIDYTIFKGNTRMITTIEKDGKRIVGTQMSPKVEKGVIKKGEKFIGEAKINSLTYMCVYVPKGDYVLFAGKNINELEKKELASIMFSTIGSFVFFIVCIIFLFRILNNKLTNPLKAFMEISRNIHKGNVGIENDATEMLNSLEKFRGIKNEIGELVTINIDTYNSLNKQIGATCETLHDLAEGDLTIHASDEYIGDFRQMGESLNQIIHSFSDSMKTIRISSEQVSSGCDQIVISSQAVAEGASRQASAVEEMSASVAEVKDMIKESTENTVKASQSASNANKLTIQSNESMNNMLKAMSDIDFASQEISKVVKAIEEIAFQTNILALNAAVEAAHAGAAGKGFAVVAEEVRILAEKSAEEVNTTTELIERTVNAVKTGIKTAHETASSLNEVTNEISQIDNILRLIEVSAKQQEAAIIQTDAGFGEISNVISSNAATAEESAASSQELSSKATEMLNELMKFKLE